MSINELNKFLHEDYITAMKLINEELYIPHDLDQASEIKLSNTLSTSIDTILEGLHD